MKRIMAMVLMVAVMLSFAGTCMAYDEDVDKDEALTRGMFVSVVYRIENALGGALGDYENVFVDVVTDSEHENAISWAAAAGIVVGVGEGVFAPDEYITREQMAVILHRYYKYRGIAPTGAWAIRLNWADAAEISEYAFEGMMFAKLKGMVESDENGNVNPKGIVTGDDLREVIGNFYFNEIK